MEFKDLSTYLSGIVYSDDPEFYDSANKVWHGQGPFADNFDLSCKVAVGTPTFTTVKNGRAAVMDNLWQAFVHCPCPWEGVLVTIMQGGMTGNGTVYPMIFGAAASIASNPRLSFVRTTASSFSRRLTSAATSANLAAANQNALVSVHSLLQAERKARASENGETFTDGSVIADAGSGVPIFCGDTESAEYGFKIRIGNLSGAIGDFSASAHTLPFCAHHFLRPEALTTGLAEFQAAIDTANARYKP